MPDLKIVKLNVSDEDNASVKDVLKKALESEHIRSVVILAELEDGTLCVRHSSQKELDLAWKARSMQIYVDGLIMDTMEVFDED